MSTTQQLAERYREHQSALNKQFLAQTSMEDIDKRKAFWKMHRRLRKRIYPRGTNFVLKFEGVI